jgi:acetyl esterase/lipase
VRRTRRLRRPAPITVAAVLAAVIVGSVALPGTADAATKPRCPKQPTRNVQYRRVEGVDPKLLSVDVFPPEGGCPAPVVVWVHGGGWQIGDKSNQMTDKVTLLNDLGYVVVSVNYRLTDPAADDPVQYPTHSEDVAAAVAWAHDRIGKYGGDPRRIALMGHSAGAQIVANVATDPQFLAAHDLALDDLACVAPLDTEGFDVTRQGQLGTQLYLDAFGTDPDVWADASAINDVTRGAGIPPHLLVRRGTLPRQRQLEAYANALIAAGIPVTIVDARGLSHNQVNSQIGAPGDTVMTPAVTAFLAECFGSDRR